MQATIPPPLTYKISALPNELIQHMSSPDGSRIHKETEFESAAYASSATGPYKYPRRGLNPHDVAANRV